MTSAHGAARSASASATALAWNAARGSGRPATLPTAPGVASSSTSVTGSSLQAIASYRKAPREAIPDPAVPDTVAVRAIVTDWMMPVAVTGTNGLVEVPE